MKAASPARGPHATRRPRPGLEGAGDAGGRGQARRAPRSPRGRPRACPSVSRELPRGPVAATVSVSPPAASAPGEQSRGPVAGTTRPEASQLRPGSPALGGKACWPPTGKPTGFPAVRGAARSSGSSQGRFPRWHVADPGRGRGRRGTSDSQSRRVRCGRTEHGRARSSRRAARAETAEPTWHPPPPKPCLGSATTTVALSPPWKPCRQH